MSIKLVAIGNILMGDDGVAVVAAEKLKEILADAAVDIIIGETDYDYCIDQIEPNDELIILDASDFGSEPGTVKSLQYEEYGDFIHSIYGTQHEFGLLHQLGSFFDMKKVRLICIEASNISMGAGLSEVLAAKLEFVVREIADIIQSELKDK